MIRIEKKNYRALKELYVTDEEAIKYPFPFVSISENTDNTINVIIEFKPSPYIVEKMPWLKLIIQEHNLLDFNVHKKNNRENTGN